MDRCCMVAGATPAWAHFRFPLASGMDAGMNRPATELRGTDELAAVMDSVAGGDRGAFRILYQRTSAKLYGICLRLLGSEAEAQDVLQEVYVTVWRKAAQFDPSRAAVVTWLATLARNRAIDRLRARRLPAEDLDAAADVADGGPSAFDVLDHEQDAARLSHCLDELEERSRQVIRAAFFDGATYAELATREEVPLGTMKSWIRRGLLRLRGCLEQ